MARQPVRGADSVVLGLARLGRFRKDGFPLFEASTQGFLASLAPWLAFLLVGGVLMALEGRPLEALTDVVVLVCWLLTPAVVTQAVAVGFRRDDRWLRFATAMTWCEWLLVIVYAASLLVVSLGLELGLPPRAAPFVLVGLISGYWLALHVFLARAGLDLTPVRAVAVVVAVMAADGVLFAVGRAVGGAAAALFAL